MLALQQRLETVAAPVQHDVRVDRRHHLGQDVDDAAEREERVARSARAEALYRGAEQTVGPRGSAWHERKRAAPAVRSVIVREPLAEHEPVDEGELVDVLAHVAEQELVVVACEQRVRDGVHAEVHDQLVAVGEHQRAFTPSSADRSRSAVAISRSVSAIISR